MADVKSSMLSKVVQGSTPAPVAQQGRDADEKKLSTDESSSKTPLAPGVLRTAVLEELLGTRLLENHFYSGTIGPNYGSVSVSSNPNGFVQALNNISVGTAWNQRLGDSVRNVRIRLCIHYRPFMLNSSVDVVTDNLTDATYSGAARIALVLDKMPAIGAPVAADNFSIGTNPPSSVAALWCFPTYSLISGALNGGPSAMLLRNPQTMSRYSVLREELVDPASKAPNLGLITTGGSTSASYCLRNASHYIDWDVDLRGIITDWSDQNTNSAQITHKLYLIISADAPTGNPAGVMWNGDLVFENTDGAATD